jgi:hypothetical protein
MEICGRAGAIRTAHTEGKEAKRSKKKNRKDLFNLCPLHTLIYHHFAIIFTGMQKKSDRFKI